MALTAMPQQRRSARAGVAAMAALVLGLLLTLLLAVGIAGQRSAAQLAADGDEMQRSQAVLAALASLQAVLAAAGNGQRDVADGAQREPAAGLQREPAASLQRDPSSARAAAEVHMARLRQLLATDAEQFSRLVTLGTALAARLDALAAPAEPRRRALAAAQPPVAADAARLQDAVQAAVLQLQDPAQAALAGAQQRHAAAAERAALWWWLATAAALLLVAGLATATWRLWQVLGSARADAATAAAQQQARTSDLQRVLTVAPEPICVLDADARVVFANAACLQHWGIAADAAAGTLFLDTVLPDDRRKTQRVLDQLLAGSAVPDFSHRVQQPDGSVAAIQWQAQWSATDATLVCAGRDVSALRALRTQTTEQALALRQRDVELAAATAQARDAGAVQARFLATLGSGLVDPLDAVADTAGVLLQGLAGPLASEQQRQLRQLHASARQVRAVVHDMQDIARIDAGAVVLQREPFDLWEAIQQVANALRPQVQDKGLVLQLELADDLGYARGDERRLQQVLTKLLDNAIRCTTAGTVTLAAQPLTGGLLAISVADTGAGIAAADVARLFEPFRQAGAAQDQWAGTRQGTQQRSQKSLQSLQSQQATQHGGVGLGLAIAQRLARLMGGSIAVASRPGQGSTFTLTLPSDTAEPVVRA